MKKNKNNYNNNKLIKINKIRILLFSNNKKIKKI